MTREHDDDLSPELLEELRSAWREVAPPELSDELGDADETTQRTVEWMRAAWEVVEVPTAPSPRAAREPANGNLRLLGRHRARVWAGAAAAALLLTIAFVFARDWLQRESDPARPFGAEGGVENAGARERPGENSFQAPEGSPPEPILSDEPQVASLSPDHIELRSGPVRLILLDTPRTQDNLGERR